MGMYDEDASIGRDVGRMDKRASDFPTEHANVYRDREREAEPSDARITAQLAYMADQLTKTGSLINELEERIAPILMPHYSEPSSLDGPDRKQASDLSNVIDDLNGVIGHIQNNVVQITKRVQL